MKDLQFHDAANIFPLIDGNDFDDLVEDIRKNGVRESIKIQDGKILDGRNRYRAALLAQQKPRYETVNEADPIAYVVSLNMHRRHLTPSQLAVVGARAREYYDKEANARQGKRNDIVENLPQCLSGRARDLAGKAVGVSGKTIDFATKVLEKGTPDLVKAVEQGRVAVSTAAIVAHESPEVQKSFLEDPKRNRVYKPGNGKPKETGTEGRSDIKRVVSDALALSRMAIMQLERIEKTDPKRLDGFDMVEAWIERERAK